MNKRKKIKSLEQCQAIAGSDAVHQKHFISLREREENENRFSIICQYDSQHTISNDMCNAKTNHNNRQLELGK